MKCLLLISNKNNEFNQKVIRWFSQINELEVNNKKFLDEIEPKEKVVIALGEDNLFNKSMVQTVEYLNNTDIPTVFLLIDDPMISANLRYFIASKNCIVLNSSKSIDNQLFGYECFFC